MRRPRYKSPDDAFYHISTRVAGSPNYFPLLRPRARKKLLDIILFYTGVYSCELVAYEIMGNLYRFIAFMPEFSTLSREELEEKARLLYGDRAPLKTRNWSSKHWEKFNRKLFDLSFLLQHINGEFAKWFNQTYGRRGHFWADRFKNAELLGSRSLQECLFHLELEAVTARLVTLPEEWPGGSASARFLHLDQALMPLEKIFPGIPLEDLFDHYRFCLFHRGGLDTSRLRIPKQAYAVSLEDPGLLRDPCPFFTEGLAVACEPGPILERLALYQEQGMYLHRKKASEQAGGRFYTVREQRSNARR